MNALAADSILCGAACHKNPRGLFGWTTAQSQFLKSIYGNRRNFFPRFDRPWRSAAFQGKFAKWFIQLKLEFEKIERQPIEGTLGSPVCSNKVEELLSLAKSKGYNLNRGIN